jgi:hypothetical protein
MGFDETALKCGVFEEVAGVNGFSVEVAGNAHTCLNSLTYLMEKVESCWKSPYPHLGGLGKIA